MQAAVDVISITFNQTRHDVAPGTTLAEFLSTLMTTGGMATAVNEQFVPRSARANYVLQAGDVVLAFEPIVGG